MCSFLSVFCFSSRRRHTRWPRDWSSDVCSSDLTPTPPRPPAPPPGRRPPSDLGGARAIPWPHRPAGPPPATRLPGHAIRSRSRSNSLLVVAREVLVHHRFALPHLRLDLRRI